MTKDKVILYQKAYVELLELIKYLSNEEKSKIPESFIKYIKQNRDNDYEFHIDNNKGILDQEYMLETKALIVKLYELYLAPNEEKELWQKYDKICLNKIEEEKSKKYNTDIFKRNDDKSNETEKIENLENNEKISKNSPIIYKKENILQKAIKYIKRILFKEQ